MNIRLGMDFQVWRRISLILLSFMSFSMALRDTKLTLNGRLVLDENFPNSIDDDHFETLKGKVIDAIERESSVNRSCFILTVSFSKDFGTSQILADYVLGIDLINCDIQEGLIVSNISATLGVRSLIFRQSPGRYPGVFWKDPMNSILVFAGCAALVLVIAVICIVVSCRQCHHSPTHNSSSLSSTNKLMRFQSLDQSSTPTTYATDTIVMDVPRRQSRVVNGSSTIERWVHSELGKSRDQKDAQKIAGCSHDMTTDNSGIVASSPRQQRTKDHPDDDTIDSNQPQLSYFKKTGSHADFHQQPATSVNEKTPNSTDNRAYTTESDPTRLTTH